MTELDALLASIVAEPCEDTLWLAVADYLDEHDEPRRAELLRLHRKLLRTCCEPDAHPEREGWQARMVELLIQGVEPCVPRKTLTLPGGVAMSFSFVPPGCFFMGSCGEFSGEEPVHRVVLTRGWFMGSFPVTQPQWYAVMATDPSRFKGSNRPVENVSWFDCQAFCANLNAYLAGQGTVRLPTEAEWEYGCRAGTTTDYYLGEVINTDLANYDGTRSWNGSPLGQRRAQTVDVGSFPPNPWGLFDLLGNVSEWCEDWELPYMSGDQTDPCAVEQSEAIHRVLRGGSWLDGPERCRVAYRDWNLPAGCFWDEGFRVCFCPT